MAALCTALPVRAALPYNTASTVSELIADINYANSAGGAITINLAPGTTFVLTKVNNTNDNGNGLPVIGGTTAVNLTIICNGDAIECTNLHLKNGNINAFSIFDVAAGASLTLDKVILQGATAGAVLNRGTLNIINGSSVSSNSAIYSGTYAGGIGNVGGTMTVSNSIVSDNFGGDIYNDHGTATISGSTVSLGYGYQGASGTGIFNDGGTMAIISSTVSGNSSLYGDCGGIYNASGTLTVSNSILEDNISQINGYTEEGGLGGVLYNYDGTVEIDYSTLSGNSADLAGGGIYNWGGTLTVNHSTLSGNLAGTNWSIVFFTSSFGGGGIYNVGTLTVENSSMISGNAFLDVFNGGTLYLDSSSEIGILGGSPANL